MAASISTRDDDEMISGINVTPLVDISLVLLIVFLVTAKLVVSQAEDVHVPPAQHAGPVQSPLSLDLGADGRVLVGGAPVASDAAVVALARAARAADPQVRAILRADGAVPHARVIRAIDLLREAGVTHVAFGVAAGEPAAPLVAGPRLQ
jgi:biopolymer transport protein ExbD